MYYVRLDGLTQADLEFFGYQLVAQGDEFELYRDYRGDEHIVHRRGVRYLLVDDPNDAQQMADRGGQEMFNAPPRDI